MGNDLNNKGVLVIDSTGTLCSETCVIRALRLVPAAAASSVTFTNTAGDEIAKMAAAANGTSDSVDFGPDGFSCEGLKVSAISGTGAKAYVYGK